MEQNNQVEEPPFKVCPFCGSDWIEIEGDHWFCNMCNMTWEEGEEGETGEELRLQIVEVEHDILL